MGLFNWLFGTKPAPVVDASIPIVNPASGLPMLNEAIDVAGNSYGTDVQDHLGHGRMDWESEGSSCALRFENPPDFGCGSGSALSDSTWD